MNIDFVILWVDGGDEKWLAEKNRYSQKKADYSSDVNRFRDFDNLQYWFRAVEKFAPWVNNIYFITWGHLPKWLNVNAPKLRIINHRDYMPEEYLPTFNSNAIELNLHRIPELSEHFVLFNDDMFLLDYVEPEDFFIDGMPRDQMIESVIQVSSKRYRIAHTHVNNMEIINEHFNKREMVKKHFTKMINPLYGKYTIKSLLLLPFRQYVGFRAHHLPQPHLKSTFETVWEAEFDALDATCRNKFRGLNDVSHWLMKNWNMCSNRFVPQSAKIGAVFNVAEDNSRTVDYIVRQKGKMVCVNDVVMIQGQDIDFERAKEEIKCAFEKILPEKSSFELP